MDHGLSALLVFLSAALGLLRVARGPSAGDRMLAVQLCGTGGTAILLLLSAAPSAPPALLDVALVYALLAAVTQIAFAHFLPDPPSQAGERRRD